MNQFYVTAKNGAPRIIKADTQQDAQDIYRRWAWAWYQPVCYVQLNNIKARLARKGDVDVLYEVKA